ncbi:hypothetical protein [Streptomyces sp. NPDC058613]|uniref:hypothetical protein n=1 Tax=Streptomyces sp. NPDC058613 TaxID=3346556 RepID=UPI00364B1A8E
MVNQQGSGMGNSPRVAATCDGDMHTITVTVTHDYADRGRGFKAGEATIEADLMTEFGDVTGVGPQTVTL